MPSIAIAVENRVALVLQAALEAIGQPSSMYLTQPEAVYEGTPGDAVPRSIRPLLIFSHILTEPEQGDGMAGLAPYTWRVHFKVQIIALNASVVLSAKADVARAVMGAESAFTQQFAFPMWLDEFVPSQDLNPAGYASGEQRMHIIVNVGKANP